MIELRFHHDVYAGEAVDAAVNELARVGRLERAEAPGYWIVRVQARTPDKERRLAGELGNRALGDSALRRRHPGKDVLVGGPGGGVTPTGGGLATARPGKAGVR